MLRGLVQPSLAREAIPTKPLQSSSSVVGSGTVDVSGSLVVKFAEYVDTIGL